MTHKYDAEFKEGMLYVVECRNDPLCFNPTTYHSAKIFQSHAESLGIEAIIRMWGEA